MKENGQEKQIKMSPEEMEIIHGKEEHLKKLVFLYGHGKILYP